MPQIITRGGTATTPSIVRITTRETGGTPATTRLIVRNITRGTATTRSIVRIATGTATATRLSNPNHKGEDRPIVLSFLCTIIPFKHGAGHVLRVFRLLSFY